jgi:hypothetical protein
MTRRNVKEKPGRPAGGRLLFLHCRCVFAAFSDFQVVGIGLFAKWVVQVESCFYYPEQLPKKIMFLKDFRPLLVDGMQTKKTVNRCLSKRIFVF